MDDRPVLLKDLPLTISRRYQEPDTLLTQITTPDNQSQPSLVIGISMKSGRNVTQMSLAVNRVLKSLRRSVIPPDLAMERVNDLPRQWTRALAIFK